MQKFDCKCCGDCCSGDMKIKLNIFDLYKLGKHLNLSSTKELFTKQIVKLVLGQNSIYFPELQFKKYPYKFCPFLINDLNENNILKGYCSLHPYIKPLVCILAPHGKEIDINKDKTTYSFIKPTESCNGVLIGEELSSNEIFKPINKELQYEKEFYLLLCGILEKEEKNYIEKIYHFNIEYSFDDILSSIKDSLV